MKIHEPKSLKEFLDVFEKLNNDGKHYYRGQSDTAWSLITGLGRNSNLKNSQHISKIEQSLLRSFKKVTKHPSCKDNIYIQPNGYHDTWQWVMIAQHYGLPTRLLDFSIDKSYALQFAICVIENLEKSGAFFIYKIDETYKDPVDEIFKSSFFLPLSSFMFQVPIYFNSNYSDNLSSRRQLIQRSKFFFIDLYNIFKCLSENSIHSNNITKVVIQKDFKLDLIKYLIEKEQFDYNPYILKNKIDNFAAILKETFMQKVK